MLVRGMPSSPSSAGPGARGRGRAKSLIFPPWARRERGGAYPSPRIPLRRGAGMAYTVPDLSYPFDALEPHIDAKTMEIHHDKHHGAYVTNLNAALEGTEWMDHPIESVLANLDALPEDKRMAVPNKGGGHANHSLFWEIMSPDGGGEPVGALADAISETFGSAADPTKEVN